MPRNGGIVKIIGGILAALAIAALTSCAVGQVVSRRHDASPQDSRIIERGQRQFRVSCSGCHGVGANGNGPIAPILNVPVPDLTLIAKRRGKFPADEIYRMIDGQADLSAHGPRHMPVWGYEFFGDDPDDEVAHAQATQKIESVVSYLRSIQR
jgi:mono/diheme cytochrome c family protein